MADMCDPDTRGPDVSGPDVSGPDVSGPDVSGPDVSGPDVSGPDVTVRGHRTLRDRSAAFRRAATWGWRPAARSASASGSTTVMASSASLLE
jgi:hypothetical protein